MKRTVFLGLLVILLAFGLIGCDDSNGNNPKIYTVTIETLSNGTITASPTSGIEGTEITLTVSPNICYQLKAGTLKYGTTLINETTKKFNLPGSNVTVTAEFEFIGYPEDWTEEQRWYSWANSESTATLDHFSIDNENVVTITVGGLSMSENEVDGWNAWRVQADYLYTSEVDTSYKYVFEAWTQSGTRDLRIHYFSDDETDTYLGPLFPLTTERKTYTIIGQALPKGGVRSINFLLANGIGTVYIKMLSIEETDEYPDPDWWTWIRDEDRDTVNITTFYDMDTSIMSITINGIKDTSEGDAVHLGYNNYFNIGPKYQYIFKMWIDSDDSDLQKHIGVRYMDSEILDYDVNNDSSVIYEYTDTNETIDDTTMKFHFKYNGTYFISIISIVPVN